MSYSSGTFSINSSGQPVVTGTVISSTVFNALTADLATGLSTCVLKDGTQTMTANIPMGAFKLTGVGAATARTDAATLANIQDGTGVYVGTVGGTADAITLTPAPAITAYAAGQAFFWIASGANTGATTLQVSGLASPKAVTKNGSTALVAGDIPSGALVGARYDGTRFQLIAVVADRLSKAGDTSTGSQIIQKADQIAGLSTTSDTAALNLFVNTSTSGEGSVVTFSNDQGGKVNSVALVGKRVNNGGVFEIWTKDSFGGSLTKRLSIDGIDASGPTTFFNPIITPAATTSIPSINLPHGTAPTSPTNGDMWTTTEGLFARINSVTYPFSSGVYTPTLTNTTNLDGSTAFECQWLRIGNTVVVGGILDIDPTAAAATELRLSLPVASNLGASSDLGGSAACLQLTQAGGFVGEPTTNLASLQFIAVDGVNRAWSFTFVYQVI